MKWWIPESSNLICYYYHWVIQEKKNTLKSLADQEMESIKVQPKQASSKISRLQIQVS